MTLETTKATVKLPTMPINNGSALATLSLVVGFCVMGGSVIYKHAEMASGSPVTPQAEIASDPAHVSFDPDDAAALTKLARARTIARDAEQLTHALATAGNVPQVSLANLRSNPFRADQPDAVVERSQRDAERRSLLRAVQRLQLRSIEFNDSRKTCTINNTLYREGQTVDSFTIERIGPDSVIVKSGMYRFELK